MEGNEDSYEDLWILAATAKLFNEVAETLPFQPRKPGESSRYGDKDDNEGRRAYKEVGASTHMVRMVLKSKHSDLIHGIDVYVNLLQEKGTVDVVWEEVWEEEGSKYRGKIQKALTWVSQLADPFYVQLEKSFLSGK
ncbi:hypothetical protein [Brevibacillus choshinensis]|uniref:Uncharacterized protein n=1 Tax=Brevibacillus choshinensis TaxID=54911 RepID=A0ABX7FPV4_BRECH|nr:hypothetical protein [Brevibacillus choshinensis]QRG67341.1 hypothetical protein JNE38_28545 [Brevibacillus choshinensis]